MSENFDTTRLLLDPTAPDAQTFRFFIDAQPFVFTTGGVNGKSAEDTAIGNVMDVSEQVDAAVRLYSAERYLGSAEAGIFQPLLTNHYDVPGRSHTGFSFRPGDAA